MGPLTAPVTQALGWTLLHSVWQVGMLALALALGLRVIARNDSARRYLLGCVALILCLLAPVLTYRLASARIAARGQVAEHVAEYGLLGDHACPPAPAVCEAIPTPAAIDGRKLAPGPDLSFLESRLPYLVAGWLVGVLLLSLLLLGRWLAAESFKRRHGSAVPVAVATRLALLRRKLRVRRTVEVLISGVVDSPLVIGVLKPVLLIPTSALTGLTLPQLESVLAHELAHIRRHDYLVNLLQCVAETLLFYHPGAWWISGRIRVERENACDDLAVRATGRPLTYARALVQLETLRRPRLGVAATGGDLPARIGRIVAAGSPGGRSPSGLVGLGALLTIGALSLALTLPQWVAAQGRSAESRPQLWVTMFGLTVRLGEDGSAVEKIPVSGYLILEERAAGVHRRITVSQARSGEFAYAYLLDGAPAAVDAGVLAWYRDAFERSLGYIYRTSPEPDRLSYRSFVRNGAFTSFAHVYQKHQFYEIVGLVSRRGEVLHEGEVLTAADPGFRSYAEESVLNDIGRLTHLAAHDLYSNLPEVGDTLVESFNHDLLAYFVPTRRVILALLEMAAEVRTEARRAAVLLELAPHLPAADARLAADFRALAATLSDPAERSEVLTAVAHLR